MNCKQMVLVVALIQIALLSSATDRVSVRCLAGITCPYSPAQLSTIDAVMESYAESFENLVGIPDNDYPFMIEYDPSCNEVIGDALPDCGTVNAKTRVFSDDGKFINQALSGDNRAYRVFFHEMVHFWVDRSGYCYRWHEGDNWFFVGLLVDKNLDINSGWTDVYTKMSTQHLTYSQAGGVDDAYSRGYVFMWGLYDQCHCSPRAIRDINQRANSNEPLSCGGDSLKQIVDSECGTCSWPDQMGLITGYSAYPNYCGDGYCNYWEYCNPNRNTDSTYFCPRDCGTTDYCVTTTTLRPHPPLDDHTTVLYGLAIGIVLLIPIKYIIDQRT